MRSYPVSMELSIIIPTRDRGPVFDQTLRAARKAIHGLDAEIIVVNDSKKTTPRMEHATPHLKLLQNGGRGVAAARNMGAKEAAGNILVFLDDDIITSQAVLKHILDVHREIPDLALNPDWTYPPELLSLLSKSAFGRFLLANNMTTFRGWYADEGWREQSLFESLSVASFHLSLSRHNFIKTGGYDEHFPYAGFEDYDFPVRLQNAGMTFRIDTRLAVFHNEADRVVLETWLNSQERRAHTRAVAVNRGYAQLAISYGAAKKLILQMVGFLHPVVLGLVNSKAGLLLPDPIAFRLIGYLQAAKIYKGYSRGLKQ